MEERSQHECAELLICLICFTSDKVKKRIAYLADKSFFDQALHKMIKGGLLPEWFRNYFRGYDSLHSTLCGLADLWPSALNGLLVSYEFTATTRINILISDSACKTLLHRLGVQEEIARDWARTLEENLLKAEADHERFLRGETQ